MSKAEVMKVARAKRDSEREILKHKDISYDEYIAERRRINNEFVAVQEANKPTHRRLSAWLQADNTAFEHWQKSQ